MEITAQLNNYRQSPRKARLVLDLIRGLDTSEALAQLKFLNKKSAVPVMKLLRSAMANAEHNYSLDQNSLYIKRIYAEAGKTLKRWKPRAFGRTAPILKKSCHISLILEEKLANLSANSKKKSLSLPLDRGINKSSLSNLSKSEQLKIAEPQVVKNLEEIKQKMETEETDNQEITNDNREIRYRFSEEKQEKRKNFDKFKGFVKKMFTRKVG